MKNIATLDDLAIFGANPAFDRTLHVGQPNVGDIDEILVLIRGALERRQLTNGGPLVTKFEETICQLLGVKHCIAMCNGTVGLEIAVRALELSGEVIIPSFTFIATAHCLQWQEITPVFCDIDPHTHTLDPKKVERLITPRTSAILGVHLWGNPCGVKELQAIADRHDIALLFDASHALGCSHGNQMIGNFGRAEVFSFHATKVVNTFEGGAVVTNDDILAKRLRFMRNFGFKNMDRVDFLGTNGKMSEPSGAMGIVSLQNMEQVIETNYFHHSHYRDRLADITGIRFLDYNSAETRNYQYLVLEVDSAKTGLSRNALMQVLHRENIRARRYFFPGCHRMLPYRAYYPTAGMLLPETEALCERVLCLPTGKNLSRSDVATVCDIVSFAVSQGPQLSTRLPSTNADALPPLRKSGD